ncbi:MAG TPA: L-threonylcarbamoyladenylate synthase [Candidatus Limnocylindrales bacterium]|nr:L-threonylcarbamoyladenylate synthase [Candidatus Limnocylindrales bacterium]
MSGVPASLDLRGDPDADLARVIRHLQADGLVAYPTETVYGVGGRTTRAAVERLRRLKARETEKPFILLVESPQAVEGLRWTPAARDLAEVFWPGSLTLVLEDPLDIFPGWLRDPGRRAVGVRVSPHAVVARLLKALGGPLTSTSLNAPGEPPAMSGAEAVEVLRRLGAGDVLVLDAGTLPHSGPSTIVDCTGDEPRVLREGSVPLSRLRCAIPRIHGNEPT